MSRKTKVRASKGFGCYIYQYNTAKIVNINIKCMYISLCFIDLMITVHYVMTHLSVFIIHSWIFYTRIFAFGYIFSSLIILNTIYLRASCKNLYRFFSLNLYIFLSTADILTVIGNRTHETLESSRQGDPRESSVGATSHLSGKLY